jgi:WD40 repeat protein
MCVRMQRQRLPVELRDGLRRVDERQPGTPTVGGCCRTMTSVSGGDQRRGRLSTLAESRENPKATAEAPSPAAWSESFAPSSTSIPSYDLRKLPVVDPGRYEILGEIGRGGLGRVLRAFDRRLDRVVAIKEMLEQNRASARFVHEAIATAGLEHPSIVPVYDVGRWPTGEPFYAMKLVSGRSLDAVVRELPTLSRRLTLLPNVIAVADAMAYAHSKLLIHRDLKPANVLVGAFGETIVIDWGLAKSLAEDAPPTEVPGPAVAAEQGMTVAGTILGTPAYMPPEQAAGTAVDEGADVYALGAILYFVLAGQPPHDASDADAMQHVRAGRPIPLEERQQGIPPDLLTIVNRAMARDPGERYASARELADDMRRFQAGQLVTSHQYSPWALVARWLRKHRVVVGLSGTLLVALAVVGIVSLRNVVRARVAAEAARVQAESATRIAEAKTNSLLLAQARALLEVDPTAALAVLETYPDGGAGWDDVGGLASDAWSRGVAKHVLRGRGEFLDVTASPDGKWIAGAGADKRIHLWDSETGSERLLAVEEGEVSRILFSPDGRSIVSSNRFDSRAWVWDVDSGAKRPLEGHAEGLRWLGVSATGVLATTSRDLTIRVWNVATGEGRVLTRVPEFASDGRAAISRDGKLLAYGGIKQVHLFDVETGVERALPEHDAGTGSLAFSDDGRRLVSGGMDGTVRVWGLTDGSVRVMTGHRNWVSSLALSPDGRLLVTSAGEGSARLWNLDNGEGRVLPAALGDENVIAFSPDSRRFAIAGSDRVVRVWEVASLAMQVLRGHSAPVSKLTFLHDGRTIVSASLDRTIRAWDLAPGGLRQLALPEGQTDRFKFSSDGRYLAVARHLGHGEALFMTDTRSGVVLPLGDSTEPRPPAAALAPDGSPLADGDAPLRLYVTDGGSCGFRKRIGNMDACAYSPDGTLVASGGIDKTVRVWDQTTATMRELGDHEGSVLAVAFSPDGTRVASGGTDRVVRFWDLATGKSAALRGHEGHVEDVAFSPDGSRIASVSMDGTLRIWDPATGNADVYAGDQLAARSVVFADERSVLVGERSGSVRIWDLTTKQSRVVRRHASAVGRLGLAPDGKTVLSNSADGATWLWDLGEVPAFSRDPGTLRAWMRSVTTAQIDATGTIATPSQIASAGASP